jgi:hypothetical protein
MTAFYFCLEHDRVETEANKCRADNRMGPYPTEDAARNWKSQVEERNEAWDDADEDWESWGDEDEDAEK